MKILITGGTGFIGGNFLRQALSAGHEFAVLIVPGQRPPDDFANHPHCLWLSGGLESVPWKQIEEYAPEVCVHCAWITTPGVYLESPENYRFKKSSLEFLSKARQCGVKQFVVLGTCIEYQITGQVLVEDCTPLVPTTTYAKCKNELRLELEALISREGGSLCWARVFYPYGPGEHPSRLASSIIQKLSRNEKILLKTPGSTKDYIHIDDLGAALLRVVEKKFTGAINLGTGIPVSVSEIAGTLSRLLEKPGLVDIADPPEKDSLPFVVADASRLHSLGWSPKHSMESGLKTLIQSTKVH